jgi:hypothetical protein
MIGCNLQFASSVDSRSSAFLQAFMSGGNLDNWKSHGRPCIDPRDGYGWIRISRISKLGFYRVHVDSMKAGRYLKDNRAFKAIKIAL